MSKKDFIAIAAEIKSTAQVCGEDAHARKGVELTAIGLCNVFADANPRFDRARFMAACGF